MAAIKTVLLTAVICIVQMVSSIPTSATVSFAAELYNQISKRTTNENVIFSPISIQTSLAMIYLGAEGQTAQELARSFRLISSDKDVVGKYFADILKAKSGDAQLNIANRLYVNIGLQVASKFNETTNKYFNSEVETVIFGESTKAIDTINTWVEEKTSNKIKNLLQPGSVDGLTSAVIVNAIYFNGKWQTPFSSRDTEQKPFWVSLTKSIPVDTMSGKEYFKYGVFPDLDATALEMPYKDSPISMLLLLPRQRDGLATLEEKLGAVDLNYLSSRMLVQRVRVRIPKFKIEFATGLVNDLKAIGIRSIFEDGANLSGIFQSGPPAKVSDVQQKAYIDVNEAGSEAAAASFVKIQAMSAIMNERIFNFWAEHPFVFAIKSPEIIYFIGHVAKF